MGLYDLVQADQLKHKYKPIGHLMRHCVHSTFYHWCVTVGLGVNHQIASRQSIKKKSSQHIYNQETYAWTFHRDTKHTNWKYREVIVRDRPNWKILLINIKVMRSASTRYGTKRNTQQNRYSPGFCYLSH